MLHAAKENSATPTDVRDILEKAIVSVALASCLDHCLDCPSLFHYRNLCPRLNCTQSLLNQLVDLCPDYFRYCIQFWLISLNFTFYDTGWSKDPSYLHPK